MNELISGGARTVGVAGGGGVNVLVGGTNGVLVGVGVGVNVGGAGVGVVKTFTGVKLNLMTA